MSWNVCRLGTKQWNSVLRQLYRHVDLDVLFVQERAGPRATWPKPVQQMGNFVAYGNPDALHDAAVLLSRRWAGKVRWKGHFRYAVAVVAGDVNGDLWLFLSFHWPTSASSVGVFETAVHNTGQLVRGIPAEYKPQHMVLAGDVNIELSQNHGRVGILSASSLHLSRRPQAVFDFLDSFGLGVLNTYPLPGHHDGSLWPLPPSPQEF